VHPQISINCKMLSYQYGPTFLKNAFSTLLNQCQGSSEGERGSNTVLVWCS